MLSFPTDFKYIRVMDLKEILIWLGFMVLAIITIVRIKNNIKNRRKWWEGFPTGE
jgi:hypothetical protein